MKRAFYCLTAIWFCAGLFSASAGEIAGKVVLPSNDFGGFSPAVVYVGGNSGTASIVSAPLIVDQRDRQFVPRVSAMARGTSIVFHNSDHESHNVNTNSQNSCCSFNFMVGPVSDAGPGKTEPIEPSQPGLMVLLCNIHTQMRGYVMVCPNSQFAITDSRGTFRIPDVPDGLHKVFVWQEFSKPLWREVEVSGETTVEFALEPSMVAQRSAAPTIVETAVPWAEVLRRISATLETAVQEAQKPGGTKQADQFAVDAYFTHFEGSELESAVRLYRGEERVFILERMFARIRKPLLADLAASRTDAVAVRTEIAKLIRAIEEDIRELHKQRIFDRTGLGSAAAPPSKSIGPQAKADAERVVAELRRAFDSVARLVASGDSGGAASAFADTYFQVFHRIEPALAAKDFARMRMLESRFLELRGRIQSGLSAEIARRELDSLLAEIELAADSLKETGRSGNAQALAGFWNAFVILTREGVEALLIVTALLMYLTRMGRSNDRRVIYAGLIVALFATVLTWAALQWVIAQSGWARETIEGVSALAAAALLFYVSYWLISKSEARRWQEFLTKQVGDSISAGGRWAIAIAAFLAVYREGAETILMFQPMLLNPAPQQLAGVLAGIVAAVLALAAIFWALRFASIRLAIRPFFRVTGALLFVLTIVFAGKGVTELQEAGLLAISPLPPALHTALMSLSPGVRDALGIAPTIQSLVIQATILLGAVISLAAIWLVGWLTPVTPPAAHTKSVKRKRSKTAV